MLAAPLRFGMIDFKAFGSFVGHTDRVHREVAPDPHYYLLTLGVAAGAHGVALADAWSGPCSSAPMRRKPVYLET
jgi:hypothetical protein